MLVSETELKNWIKREAWRAMEDKLLEDPRWKKDLEASKDNLYAIRPDSHEQLIGFVYCQGNVMGQAFLNTLAPFTGLDILEPKDFGTRKDVKDFILSQLRSVAHRHPRRHSFPGSRIPTGHRT